MSIFVKNRIIRLSRIDALFDKCPSFPLIFRLLKVSVGNENGREYKRNAVRAVSCSCGVFIKLEFGSAKRYDFVGRRI